MTIEWVALGPIAGTWWCTLDDPAPELAAPGGVVLCYEHLVVPHPDAERAAASVWALVKRQQQLEAAGHSGEVMR